jgi:hypothetical protein
MADEISRRRVLATGGSLLGGVFATDGTPLEATDTSTEIIGWVTKGPKERIVGEDATVESFRHLGTSLCNDGETFECRTCDGVTFFLLVVANSSSPNVGETYRFRPTGADNFCGNFEVELLRRESCTDSSPTPTETATEEPTTTETTTTTEEPTTTEEQTTTETTTTETTTTTEEPTTTETTTTETATEEPTTTETTATETTTTEEPTTEAPPTAGGTDDTATD